MTSLPQFNERLPLRPIKTSLLPLRQSPSQLRHITPAPPVSGLTRRHKLFVEGKLRGKTDKEAALFAGYSLSTAENASVVIKKHPAVSRELRRRLHEQYKDEELTTDELVNDLRAIKDANILDYGDKSEDGKSFTPNFNKITHEMGLAIEEISVDAYGRAKVKLISKLATIDHLARIKKLYNDNKNGGSGDGSPFTVQSIDSMVRTYVENITVNVSQVPQQTLPERTSLRTIDAEITHQ